MDGCGAMNNNTDCRDAYGRPRCQALQRGYVSTGEDTTRHGDGKDTTGRGALYNDTVRHGPVCSGEKIC